MDSPVLTRQELGRDGVCLRLDDGRFAAEQARSVHEALCETPRGCAVTVDFRAVREFDDFALVALGQDFAARQGQLTFLGLCEHQYRVLKYFGLVEHRPAADRGDERESG